MPAPQIGPIPRILFLSRWLQLPLYLGLIVAQGIYVWLASVLKVIIAQTAIHITFLLSAIAIAMSDRIMPHGPAPAKGGREH
jgi:uncharacterized membrane protein YqhA